VLNSEEQKDWTSYINTPGGLAHNDSLTFPDDFPALEDLTESALLGELAPIMWITGIAGAYLVSLAVLALLVGVPKSMSFQSGFVWNTHSICDVRQI
jgi:hypothetical protein